MRTIVESRIGLLSADDLYAMPEHGGRNELVQGELIKMSPASTKHGSIAMRLAGHLWNFVVPNDLGELYAAETGFMLTQNPDTVRAPDVAFILRERIPDEGVPVTGFWAIAPDLVGEVISPHDRSSDVQQKVNDYLAAGVRLIWLVDPQTQTVTVYQSREQVHILLINDSLDGADVLPGFSLPLTVLF